MHPQPARAVAGLSLWQDRRAHDLQTTPDLTVVLFEAVVEDGIDAERTGPELGDIAPIKGGRSGPAVAISVLNSGEEPGLLVDIEVAVRELWSLDSCWAAGGTEVTAHYDVSLPDDLDPAALPRVLHAASGFEVAGKDGEQAAAVCVTRDADAEGDCYGRFLSHVIDDRPLRCRPDDTDPEAHCRRQ